MSLASSSVNMNTVLDIDEDLRRQLAEQTARVANLNKEKELIMNHIAFRKSYVDSLMAEMMKMNENPSYYSRIGIGNIGKLASEAEAVEKEIRLLEESAEELNQPIDDAEETREHILFMIADKIGLETLRNKRRQIGKEMAMHNRIQHEAYELQKERYENCKKTFGFTPDDRQFIDHHKMVNKTHMDEWMRLSHKREQICELIDTLDPNDEDLGFDEDEDV